MDRLLLAWSLIALLGLSIVTAVWMLVTHRHRKLRQERRGEIRREAAKASRGVLPSDHQ